MNSITSQCILAASIKNIIWIDDLFAPLTRNELAEAIRGFMLHLKNAGRDKVNLIPFDTIPLAGPRAHVEDALEAVLEEMSDREMHDAATALATVTNLPLPNPKPQPDDLSPEAVHELKLAFGQGLQTFSLGAWTSGGAERFVAAGEDTFFLIDKEYKREDAGMDGTRILADLVQRSRGFCVILTHLWGETEQEARRVDLAKTYNISPHRFSVLSKRSISKVPLDSRFARAFRTVMTHRFNGEIAHTISNSIQSSAVETANALTAQSVSDLERVLFENADEEGVVEYDAVLRIFEIQQRHALNGALAKEEIQQQLQLSRRFREVTKSLEVEHISGDMTYFRDIRAREIFFEGTGLNKLHSPLSCGDVFQTDAGELYVLIAQPCDLMVRKNGERRADFGLFAMISSAAKANPGEKEKKKNPDEEEDLRSVPDYRFYDLKDSFGRDKKSIVDFQKMFAVNLGVIELATFNHDGAVQLRRDYPEPAIVLSKGLGEAFRNAKGSFFPPKKNKPALAKPIGIGSRATNLKAAVSPELLTYPLRRIGRLHSATATAVLVAWATFQTRAAFDHDFAEEKERKNLEKSEQASAESASVESLSVDKIESAEGIGGRAATVAMPRSGETKVDRLCGGSQGQTSKADGEEPQIIG